MTLSLESIFKNIQKVDSRDKTQKCKNFAKDSRIWS